MSLIVLLLTVTVAFFLSELADFFPGVLWGWLHLPTWLMWGTLLVLVAWCMGDDM